jgi:hypothetical protein
MYVSSILTILEDKQPGLLRTLFRAMCYPSGDVFFISFNNSSNLLPDKPFDVLHCNNFNVLPNFWLSMFAIWVQYYFVVLQHTLQILLFFFTFAVSLYIT